MCIRSGCGSRMWIKVLWWDLEVMGKLSIGLMCRAQREVKHFGCSCCLPHLFVTIISRVFMFCVCSIDALTRKHRK